MTPSAVFTQTQGVHHDGYADNAVQKSVQLANGPTTIIFDLGDVLFTWTTASPSSPLPPKVLNSLLRSAIWFEYERGNLDEDGAYNALAKEFGLWAADIATGFNIARDTLKSCPSILAAIREFKAAGIKVYAMSNISAPDWEFLKTKAHPEDCALFDRVFTS